MAPDTGTPPPPGADAPRAPWSGAGPPPPGGLVTAVGLDGRGGGAVLDWKGVRRWRREDGPLWVHLDCTVPEAREWILTESGIDPVVAEALLQGETRPRTVVAPDGVLVVLRGVNLSPGADPEDMVAIRMWLTADRIITTRRRHLLSVDDVREALHHGRGPVDPGTFLVAIADRLIARAAGVITDLDDQVDELEEAVLTRESHALRASLADVRREAIGLRRYLAPQRDAMARLHLEPSALLSNLDRTRLREIADRVTRYVEDLDAARDRAAVTQEELVARLSEQLNQRMYVLSVVAALFLPLGFLTGLLGINVGGIPGAENPYAFAEVTLFLALLAGMVLVLFKWRRWF